MNRQAFKQFNPEPHPDEPKMDRNAQTVAAIGEFDWTSPQEVEAAMGRAVQYFQYLPTVTQQRIVESIDVLINDHLDLYFSGMRETLELVKGNILAYDAECLKLFNNTIDEFRVIAGDSPKAKKVIDYIRSREYKCFGSTPFIWRCGGDADDVTHCALSRSIACENNPFPVQDLLQVNMQPQLRYDCSYNNMVRGLWTACSNFGPNDCVTNVGHYGHAFCKCVSFEEHVRAVALQKITQRPEDNDQIDADCDALIGRWGQFFVVRENLKKNLFEKYLALEMAIIDPIISKEKNYVFEKSRIILDDMLSATDPTYASWRGGDSKPARAM